MLAEIEFENIGVIPQASLELSSGLTVLTGETGAGKTMVVTGLRLLTGGRADASRVRVGAARAVVEGRFIVDNLSEDAHAVVREVVESAGGEPDENGEIIATRVVNANGRSKAHLGGRAVPASSLHSFSTELLTIHGQNDQLRLLSLDRQRDALDRMDPDVQKLAATFSAAYKKWREMAKKLREHTNSRMELAQEADRLDFAINEITAINPSIGEDLQLQETIRRLQDVDALREQTLTVLAHLDGAASISEYGAIEDDQNGASDLLGQAASVLLGSEDKDLRGLGDRLADVIAITGEVSAEVGRFLNQLPSDDEELDKLMLRQQELKSLTRKYAPDIEGVIKWLKKAEKKRATIDTSPEALEKLTKDVADAEASMLKVGKKLSAARIALAEKLSAAVTQEIHGLAMNKAVFVVDVRTVAPSKNGLDEVEFLLAPNSAAQPRPLATSASGGELSRVMLALEVVLSAGSSGTTMVFDEVDAGVGGRAAVEIAKRLARLAQKNQVIVVTHLPQVAAFADTHVHVSKNVGDESVTSAVEKLDDERRVEEIARMLAGLDDTETGRAHAEELLATARKTIAAWRASSAEVH
ncbi:DNA repair protein RecN [Corynebacterium kutscheri]|uniref:DNA repair protein RecN n=1 Tax=Corynebacterium kutscheri TaxID=35755 RepID=A0A0F6QZH0_9CORY|nr:DNA repair protein RecN [Corynebacterium kutscheri]AKE41152.1 DNA repair protein RecN [Corynebacterium kutscheri]VEH09472.1 DNA repair protein recN [Corynebacterium kutscheri]